MRGADLAGVNPSSAPDQYERPHGVENDLAPRGMTRAGSTERQAGEREAKGAATRAGPSTTTPADALG